MALFRKERVGLETEVRRRYGGGNSRARKDEGRDRVGEEAESDDLEVLTKDADEVEDGEELNESAPSAKKKRKKKKRTKRK